MAGKKKKTAKPKQLDFKDVLLAKEPFIGLHDILEILSGRSECELSDFEKVLNYYLRKLTDTESQNRKQWKVGKKELAQEMAAQLVKDMTPKEIMGRGLIPSSTGHFEMNYSFMLVKSSYPKEVLNIWDEEYIADVFLRLLIDCHVACLFKQWLRTWYKDPLTGLKPGPNPLRDTSLVFN